MGFGLAALVAIFAVAASMGDWPLRAAAAETIPIDARAVPLDASDPERSRVGRLEYRGGLQLSSPDPRFGGFSGLLVSDDGARLIAISDEGWLLTGRLVEDAGGRLIGLADGKLAAVRADDGSPLGGSAKSEADAESLTTDADGGLLVGFERHHRILRYPATDAAAQPVAAPPGLDAAPENEGLETLARLQDGRLLALTEGLAAPGGVVGWVGALGDWRRLTWVTSQGFAPTDATALPGTDVLVLERRFPPPGARVRRIPTAAIVEGGVLDGDEIARFEGPLTVDNMEAIAARPAADKSSIVYLLSDDNYNRVLQRTLLLMFRLLD